MIRAEVIVYTCDYSKEEDIVYTCDYSKHLRRRRRSVRRASCDAQSEREMILITSVNHTDVEIRSTPGIIYVSQTRAGESRETESDYYRADLYNVC